MPESSPLDDSLGAAGALPRTDDEIVSEQTVRTPIPVAPDRETTVKTAMPVEPPAEQTVRVFVPSAVPPDGEEEEEIEEVDELEDDEGAELEVEPEAEPEAEAIDVSALVFELEAHSRPARGDVPVPRSDQVTVPEVAAKAPAGRRKARREGPPTRSDPAAVSGEVSVSEPEPGGPFGAAAKPRREPRPDPRSMQTPTERRDDPPLVSGEVAVDPTSEQSPAVPTRDVYVMPIAAPGTPSIMTASGVQPIMTASGVQSIMTPSGSQPIMTASGSQPVMTSSGPHSVMAMTASGATPMLARTSSDAGYVTADPRARGETTGSHPVMAAQHNTRDSLVLWALAGGLVVLAVGVVMMVISWSR